MGKDLEISNKEITDIDLVAQSIVSYSEDDRRKSDDLFLYYQELIANGDTKGETREALAKALELREESVKNLIEILKLKTRLLEKKLMFEIRKSYGDEQGSKRASGIDTNDLIAKIEREDQ
jgi:hypothetical protein